MREKLSLETIKHYLDDDIPVYFYDQIDSTNTVASELAAEGTASHGTVVFARHQTQGRGRLGRSFASPDDSGIYMSIILEPDSANPVRITTAAAVAVCKAIETICDIRPEIKWVNDIYINNKKVCGILAEGINDHNTGHLSHIVLGIGINCKADAIPAELAAIAGAIEGDYSINQLAAEVYNQMMRLTGDINAAEFIEYYRRHSMVLGKNITVHKGGCTPDKPGVPARALDIDENGGLKVIYTDGSRETLSSGEISIRL